MDALRSRADPSGRRSSRDGVAGASMPVAEAAGHLGVTRQTLHRILSGRAAVTPEMAIRRGKFCGNGPGLWLRMQQAYDLWHASKKLGDEVERIPTFKDAA